MSFSTETLFACYRQLLRIRLVEEAIAQHYPDQQMRCPVHLSIGQEAVAVGVCEQLTKQDLVYGNHRSHSHYLAKGGDLKSFIAELHGRSTGCAGGRGGSMHLIDLEAGFAGSVPIVASSIPIAVGAAFAAQYQQQNHLVATFFGEAATEEGVFHESLNFAKLKNLPVLFVCENNLYSVYSPPEVRRSPEIKLTELAQAHGLKTWQVDGNDVLKVAEATKQSVDFIKSGNGPVFLQCDTYRWREHCGPNYDNDLGYRTEAEFEFWRDHCPLKIMEDYLLQHTDYSEADEERLTSELLNEINQAFEFALESPFPEAETAFDHLFAPSQSERERS